MRRTSPIVNLVLFLLTIASTLWAGGLSTEAKGVAAILVAGIPYSAALMGILLTHEMGHYVMARLHKVDATLPFFIPVPFGFGTLGAVIRIRSLLPSLKAVLDIGAAGPIAGFVVAVPLLFWGFAHSEVIHNVPTESPNALWQCPWALVSALASHQFHWPVDTKGPVEMGDSIITWLAGRVTHGQLAVGSDIQIGSVGLAAWIGMFVTTLNMTPVGQLDGGHVIYALFGRWGDFVSRMFSWALLGLGIFASWSWFVWWALARFVVGVRHPPAGDDAPLTPGGKVIAITSLAILILTFVPVPFYL